MSSLVKEDSLVIRNNGQQYCSDVSCYQIGEDCKLSLSLLHPQLISCIIQKCIMVEI